MSSPCLNDLRLSPLGQANRWYVQLEIRQPIYDRTAAHRLHLRFCHGLFHLWSGRSPMAVHDRPIPTVHTPFTPVWRHPIAAHFLSKHPCRQMPNCRAAHAVRSRIRRDQARRSHSPQLRSGFPPRIYTSQSPVKAVGDCAGKSLPNVDAGVERP